MTKRKAHEKLVLSDAGPGMSAHVGSQASERAESPVYTVGSTKKKSTGKAKNSSVEPDAEVKSRKRVSKRANRSEGGSKKIRVSTSKDEDFYVGAKKQESSAALATEKGLAVEGSAEVVDA